MHFGDGSPPSDSAPGCTPPCDGGGPGDGSRPDLGRADGGGGKADAFSGTPRVWLVGDSLAVGATTPFQKLAVGRYAVTVRAKSGATISSRLPDLQAAATAGAEAVVIQAGINDVASGTANVSTLTAAIVRSLDALPRVPCLLWVTYQTKFSGTYARLAAAAPVLNQLIRAEVAKRAPRGRVVEFQPYIDAHPELNAPDGLHLTGAGYQALARTYGDALKLCFGK